MSGNHGENMFGHGVQLKSRCLVNEINSSIWVGISGVTVMAVSFGGIRLQGGGTVNVCEG